MRQRPKTLTKNSHKRYILPVMLININNLEISVLETDLRGAAAAKLGLKPDEIRTVQILRRSIDARQHRNVRYQYQLAVETGAPASGHGQTAGTPECLPSTAPRSPSSAQPVIIGAGPAGLFAALALVERGLCPVIIERGKPAAERKTDVDRFWSVGELNPESNMYFGEGGAGTFSDGKLNTRSKNPDVTKILQELVHCGAPPEILYDAKPHVGTDRLLELLPRLRQRLIDAGATFLFNTRLSDLRRTPGGTLEVELSTGGAGFPATCFWRPAAPLIVACGHSAFDTYRLLLRRGVPMEAKATAIGVRMEHPAEFITRHFLGKDPKVLAVLGNAPYNLAVPVAAGTASAYSFCCCPGGEVVACSAVNGLVSVNGMSHSRRDSPFTNAGLVTGVSPAEMLAPDAKSSGTCDAPERVREVLAWREALERRCYELGAAAGPFAIPGQTAFDFVAGRASTRELRTSSRRPVVPTDLATALPPQIAERLREGLRAMDQKIPGWIRFGVLLGIETTTSSPVRIVRTAQGGCEGWPELLPVGEGSGYAGGIITSALDGYEAAQRWADAHRPT